MYACAINHTRAAYYLLEALDADPKQQDANKSTPLHFASYHGNLTLVIELYKRGANVRAKDNNGIQPLHLAALNGHESVVAVILSTREIQQMPRDKSGITPLHLASLYGYADIVQSLLVLGYENMVDEIEGASAINLASSAGHLEVVQILLKYGGLISIWDFADRSAYHWAAVTGRMDMMELLIEHSNMDYRFLNSHDSWGNTPLFLASVLGHLEMTAFILLKGGYVNIRTGGFLSPDNSSVPLFNSKIYDEFVLSWIQLAGMRILTWVAIFSSSTVLKVLYERCGYSPKYRDTMLLTPLHYAAGFGNLDNVKFLVEKIGIGVNMDRPSNSALAWAVINGHTECVKYLLEHGAALNNHNDNYPIVGPIHYAVFHNRIKITDLLIKAGADLTQSGYEGNTPLDIAAMCGRFEIIQMLRNAKVNIGIMRYNTPTCANLAIKHGHWELGLYLIGCGASPYGVLHTTAKYHSKTELEVLLKCGFDINHLDVHKQTALFYALDRPTGTNDVFEFLIQEGINVNQQNRMGDTILHKIAKIDSYSILNPIERIQIMIALGKSGADFNITDFEGNIPLMCKLTDNIEVIKLFVIFGSRVDVGRYLMYPFLRPSVDYRAIIELLLDAGMRLESIRLPIAGIAKEYFPRLTNYVAGIRSKYPLSLQQYARIAFVKKFARKYYCEIVRDSEIPKVLKQFLLFNFKHLNYL